MMMMMMMIFRDSVRRVAVSGGGRNEALSDSCYRSLPRPQVRSVHMIPYLLIYRFRSLYSIRHHSTMFHVKRAPDHAHTHTHAHIRRQQHTSLIPREQFPRSIFVTSSPIRPTRATSSRGCYEYVARVRRLPRPACHALT